MCNKTNGAVALQVLDQREILGKNFAIYGDTETPLFLAKDVATMIEHSDTSKMVKSVDEDEKLLGTLFVAGQKREFLFLNEDGLYEVLMLSRKPIAKEFKKNVKAILKSIRTNGAFIPNATSEETKKIANQFKGSIYLTEQIHDKKSIRKYIREYNPMQLDECINNIAEIVEPMKGSIKYDLLDVAIKELKAIDSGLIKDTTKNIYVKDTAIAGIVILQNIKIGKFKKRISNLEQVI